jgi:hypothetical protein
MKYNSVKIGSLLWVDDISSTPYTVGINDNLSELNKIYPIPADNFVNIDFKNNEQREILIYDGLGKMIEKFYTESKSLIINTSKYPSGLYKLNIQSKSGQENSRKFIVSH